MDPATRPESGQDARERSLIASLANIPGAEFIVLPEASHSINWEQPEAFNRNVLEFIRRH